VCTFHVAVNKRNKDAEKAVFFKVNAWRALAENCAKYLQKGRVVGVIGEVDVETYKTRDGEARAEMVVHAAEVEFI
jgi:single-strand DNA-binding protein